MSEKVAQYSRYRRYYRRLEPLLHQRELQGYTMVILSLFTISFFGFFAIRPTIKTITTLQKQISDKTEVNKQLEAKINALILAQEEYQRLGPHLPTIYSLLPQTPEFPLLVSKLEVLVADHAATISAITFSPLTLYDAISTPNSNAPRSPTGSKTNLAGGVESTNSALPVSTLNPTPMSFGLALKGNYSNLIALLADLTKLDRVVSINSVSLNKNDTEGASLNLSLQSRAFYAP